VDKRKNKGVQKHMEIAMREGADWVSGVGGQTKNIEGAETPTKKKKKKKKNKAGPTGDGNTGGGM